MITMTIIAMIIRGYYVVMSIALKLFMPVLVAAIWVKRREIKKEIFNSKKKLIGKDKESNTKVENKEEG